jgi:hypothetical protein
MSIILNPKTVGECGGISEAELIEIEKRASAIGTAESALALRIDYLDRANNSVPYDLKMSLERLQILSEDFRRLVALARSGALCEECGAVITRAALPNRKRTGAEVSGQSQKIQS